MNERIKELADKASQWVIDNSNGVHTPYERWNEKFAELIVKECADAIIKDSRLNDVRSAANGCVRTIKEHFGVEE
jgi:hypothetical protein